MYFPNYNIEISKPKNDRNGNKTVTVCIGNNRGFSLQTNGNMFLHSWSGGYLTPEQAQLIETETVNYISNFGSKAQKRALELAKR